MDFNSNTKVFIDYTGDTAQAAVGAPLGGALGAGGAVQLLGIADVKSQEEGEVIIVPAMGVQGGAGHREKQGGVKVMITENRQTKPQVRWRALKKKKTKFAIILQDEDNGPREIFFLCRVSKVERTGSAENEHQDSIELACLRSIETA